LPQSGMSSGAPKTRVEADDSSHWMMQMEEEEEDALGPLRRKKPSGRESIPVERRR
jgi:hypothetical protein